MKVSHLLGLMLVASFTFTACGDDDDSTTPAQSKTQLLTAKNWKMTGLTLTDSAGTEDWYADMDYCDKNQLFKFNTNMTLNTIAAADTCEAGGTGAWTFANNETQLQIMAPNSFPLVGDIVTLNASTLHLRDTEDGETFNMTFTAQ